MPEANTKREPNVKLEANIKSEKIKSERGIKREPDQESEGVIQPSAAKRVKAPVGRDN